MSVHLQTGAEEEPGAKRAKDAMALHNRALPRIAIAAKAGMRRSMTPGYFVAPAFAGTKHSDRFASLATHKVATYVDRQP